MIGIALGIAAALVFGIISCISCCCCCCAPAFCSLFSWSSDKPDSYVYTSLPPQSTAYAAQSGDIPIVEAYAIPPLAAVNPRPLSSTVSTLLDETVTHPVSQPAFRDTWAALLFLLQLLLMVGFSFKAYMGLDLSAVEKGEEEEGGVSSPSSLLPLLLFTCLTALLTSLLSSSLLYLVVAQAQRLIPCMLLGNVAALGGAALLSLLSLQVIPSLLCLFFAVVSYLYYLSVLDRIPFASALLATACSALRNKFLPLLALSLGALVAALLYLCLFSLSSLYLYQQSEVDAPYATDDEEGDASLLPSSLALLFSLFWSLQVLSSLLCATVAGSVACWYFIPAHPAPIRSSLFRASSYSFGSLCLGSLLVALLQTLSAVLSLLKSKERRRGRREGEEEENVLYLCLLSLLEYIVREVERGVQYLNKYAYSYIAAYGEDFFSSAKHALDLFTKRGWTTLVNDNLISFVLFLLCCLLTLLGGLVGGLGGVVWALAGGGDLGAGGGLQEQAVLGLVLGLVVGYIVGGIASTLLESSVHMLYVCFAQDPAALALSHPEEHRELLRAWREFSPETVVWYVEGTEGVGRGAYYGGTGTVERGGVELGAVHSSYQHSPYPPPFPAEVGRGTGGGKVLPPPSAPPLPYNPAYHR